MPIFFDWMYQTGASNSTNKSAFFKNPGRLKSLEAMGHGSRETGEKGSLVVWPNPARDWITLTLPENLIGHINIIKRSVYCCVQG